MTSPSSPSNILKGLGGHGFCFVSPLTIAFLLSEEEVFCSEKASDYSFACSDATHDPYRCAKPTRYALARGAWMSRKNGNGFWMLHTNGYNAANAVYVGDVGDIYNRGMPVTCLDALIMPALRLSIPA